jgi:hypothetical protein
MKKIELSKTLKTALPITLLAMGALPSFAAFDDVSDELMGDLTYTNTGVSVTATPYGEASGSTAVTDPSTETTVNLSLYLPKNVAMAINTRQTTAWAPGGIFAAATVPFSRFAIREDHEDLLNGSNTEFILYGLVAANVDNVQMDFDTTVSLTGPGSSAMSATIGGFGAGGATGHQSNEVLANGGSLDTSTGIAGFRLEGNIDTASVSRTADRAGTYSGSITVTATTL